MKMTLLNIIRQETKKNEHTKIYENMHVIKISVFRTPPIYFLIYDQSRSTLNLVVPTQA